MSRPLVPDHIKKLQPYKPGKPIAEVQKELGLETVYKLASNENPNGPSPKAVLAAADALSGIHRYPDMGAVDLRSVLADRFSLSVENVVTGSGSESIMANILRTFLENDDELLTSDGTFVGFYVLAQSRGVKLVTVPLKDYHYDLKAIAAAINNKTRIVYLANPNNPTGTIFTRTEFDDFMKSVPAHTLIILDEAYLEFVEVEDYPDSLIYRYDNVITLRTFSKAYGLAGLRIGYGFAHKDLIVNLHKVKLPFEPSLPAQAAGLAAINDTEFLGKTIRLNKEARDTFSSALGAKGFKVVPSQANFVMFVMENEEKALKFCNHFLHKGIVVRGLAAFRLPQCVRVSTGLPHENEAFLRELRDY
jgi:histidinol-phosphate aminotransferase